MSVVFAVGSIIQGLALCEFRFDISLISRSTTLDDKQGSQLLPVLIDETLYRRKRLHPRLG